MANKDHLIPAKKGEVRNPKGNHLHTPNFKTVAKKYLALMYEKKNSISGELENVSGMERVFFSLFNVIENSDNDSAKITAIRELLDRMEGKVSQPVDIEGQPLINTPIQINVMDTGYKIAQSEDEIKLLEEKE
jgi:hypothetical protein